MTETASAQHPTAAWILACQNEDGGFGSFPGDISAPRPTAWALEALDALELSPPRPERIAEFLQSFQGEDGGFRGRPWGLRWTEKSTLADSYHVVRSLETLGAAVPRPDALAEFVRSRRRSDGAFFQDLYPETAGTCAEVFYALSILRSLRAETPEPGRAAAFLHRMQRENVRRDGGFIVQDAPDWQALVDAARERAAALDEYRDPGPEETTAIPVTVGYTEPTYHALAALALLEDRAPDAEAAAAFLCAQQSSGSFATGLGDYGAYHDRSEGRMPDTYAALCGLRLLCTEAGESDWGRFLRSRGADPDRAAQWVAACQNPDGGFSARLDPVSRPSDMAGTAQAVVSLRLLGRETASPSAPEVPRREQLPEDIRFRPASPFFQPDQPGQALFLHRIINPIITAHGTQEAVAVGLMRWQNCHLSFKENSRNEAALIIEDSYGLCGPQARCLAGLLEAAGIPARFLMVKGHCTCEALVGGRWCLLDAMFQGVSRRADGQLCSALDVHEAHRRGKPQITTFGDWRYESYSIHQPRGDGGFQEFAIGPDDTVDSPSARRAYPELAARDGSPAGSGA